MSKKTSSSEAILELWRPPQEAGEPVGCLSTTYTFTPGLFEEQCLARFLGIESEPNREGLAFLLERESRLGSVYAGVIVDHTQAGVEHSLRWDVLRVRLPAGKQHAKLTLLEWTRHVRIMIASANLTEPGYRTNHEVAAAVDLTSEAADIEMLDDAVGFLRSLIQLVPGASESLPEVRRARRFLEQLGRKVRGWTPIRRRGAIRQKLVFTLPKVGTDRAARSSLEEAVEVCRQRGAAPNEAWIASPFFDVDDEKSRATASLCKYMARGGHRELCFCVPAIHDENSVPIPRIAAPKALIMTPLNYQATVSVEILPEKDAEENHRPWHAKMLALLSAQYSALMTGSSNFTCAGMGVGQYKNAEANLLTIVDRSNYSREAGQLEAIWPEMEPIDDPESAEWLGAVRDNEQEELLAAPPLPAGFLSATYCAGDKRQIILRLDPDHLPEDWHVHACGQNNSNLFSAPTWREGGCQAVVLISWPAIQPPEKLLVQWSDLEAFLSLNVEDSQYLPPPPQLEDMSADDMLWILSANDTSAAFRSWARRQELSDVFDSDLDSATPIDLDPLQRYDLQATFLHRIRRRARILAQLRSNLQRPVWGLQALEWRLRGLVGINQLADRLLREFIKADGAADEALLSLADFLIVLHEVEYQPIDGSLPKREFEMVFRLFLRELAEKLGKEIGAHHGRISEDILHFWKRVEKRCQR